MSRVYVGRLPSDARERDLDKFFRGYGRIREIILKDGFAFVEFDDYRDADDAVHDLDGRDCAGSRVRVEHSRPRRGSGGFGGGRDFGGGRYGDRGGGGYGGRYGGPPSRPRGTGYMAQRYGAPHRTKYQVRVENLSSRASWQDLKDFMRQAGEVTYAESHRERDGEGGSASRSRSRSRSPRRSGSRSVSRSRSPKNRSLSPKKENGNSSPQD